MTPELQAVAGPLLAKLQERIGNGYVVLTAEVSSFANKALPMVEWKAYHFERGFSAGHDAPESAVNELLDRTSKADLIAQAEHLRDRAEELERAANLVEEKS